MAAKKWSRAKETRRIDISDAYSVAFWARELNITEAKLLVAVAQAGDGVADVKKKAKNLSIALADLFPDQVLPVPPFQHSHFPLVVAYKKLSATRITFAKEYIGGFGKERFRFAFILLHI